MSKEDYYETLGVDKSSSEAEIKQAYRKKAMKYHPDRNKGDKGAEKEFKKRNFNLVLETEIDNMREDIAKLRQAIDMGLVKQDMGAARIAMLQKELRGAIKQIDDKKVLMDKQGLILAGADRALREMLSIFRDDPIEGPLQEASMGVWTKILQEES